MFSVILSHRRCAGLLEEFHVCHFPTLYPLRGIIMTIVGYSIYSKGFNTQGSNSKEIRGNPLLQCHDSSAMNIRLHDWRMHVDRRRKGIAGAEVHTIRTPELRSSNLSRKPLLHGLRWDSHACLLWHGPRRAHVGTPGLLVDKGLIKGLSRVCAFERDDAYLSCRRHVGTSW